MASHSAPPERAFAWYDLRLAPGRVAAGFATGLTTALLCGGSHFTWGVQAIVGWDAGSVMLLGLTWWIIARADAAETRRRASAEDPGRTTVWVLALLSSFISLFAATFVLRQVRLVKPDEAGTAIALCLIAVATAWLLTHSAFTLRYARLYYREDDDDGVGGLEFPGGHPPADYDFAYFAFTIGMCFQVSDVVITSSVIRRAVLVHALIAFAYNTTILALALNLMFGQFD